jgi:hypothetical protein
MSQRLTVDQSFKKFITNLEPTEKQQQRIRTTREKIDSVLANDSRIVLNTQKQPSFLTGSCARNTLIRPINDIDLYVRVHYGRHAENKSPLSILRLIAASIRDQYRRNTRVDVDSPCVVVRFRGYSFEVAPVVGYSDDPDLYDIPAPGSKTWMQCYPNVPSKWLSSCNHINNGMFIPMIKILKQWNRTQKIGLKSFHLELLTESVFTAKTEIKSFPQGIFDWIFCVKVWVDDYDTPFIPEPGQTDKFVDEYLYQNRPLLRRLRRKLERWEKLAERAFDFYSKGRNAPAKRIYRNMFGSMFPAPEPLQAKPVAAPPRLEHPPTLKDFAASKQPMGPLPDLHSSVLANILENPSPRPTGLLSGETNNALLDAILKPQPKPTNVLTSDAGRNALIDLLANYRDPFKK